MVFRPIFYSALNIVRKVLAADFGCERTEFENEGIFIHRFARFEGARRFPVPDKPFDVITMGRGVVVSCSLARLGWADAHLSQLSRNDIFAPPAVTMINEYLQPDHQIMSEPKLKYICTDEIFREPGKQDDVEISLVTGQELLDLYKDNRFPNSLGPYPTSQLPMAVAAIARVQGNLAGIAAVCEESDTLWQVGVDTLPEYRKRGVGKRTVGAVTRYILDKGIIPYYSTLESNPESRALAESLGYKTAWIEMYCKDIKA
jgi:GNAT superfamily N-acetyltransferase